MLNELKIGLRFTLVTMALLGGAYHAVLWGVGRIVFPAQAEGSLVRRPDGAILGSRLLAQRFARSRRPVASTCALRVSRFWQCSARRMVATPSREDVPISSPSPTRTTESSQVMRTGDTSGARR